MPSMWGDTDIRIGAGTLTAAVLDGAFAVSVLPVQVDQGSAPWFIANDGLIVPLELQDSLALTTKENGGTVNLWRWGILTPDMFTHVRDTFLGGEWSGVVTIRDLSRLTGDYETYNCTAKFRHPSTQSFGGDGFSNYEMDLLDLVVAAAS